MAIGPFEHFGLVFDCYTMIPDEYPKNICAVVSESCPQCFESAPWAMFSSIWNVSGNLQTVNFPGETTFKWHQSHDP